MSDNKVLASSQAAGTVITYARTHDRIFVPNVIGDLGPVLTAEGPGAKTHDLKMWLTPDGEFLQIFIKGTEVLIPKNNVSYMIPNRK